MPMPLLYWGAWNLTQYSRHGPTSAERRRTDHLLWHGANTLLSAAQDSIELLCDKGPLLAHILLGVHQDPRSLFAKLLSSICLCLGVFMRCVELTVVLSPSAIKNTDHETTTEFNSYASNSKTAVHNFDCYRGNEPRNIRWSPLESVKHSCWVTKC